VAFESETVREVPADDREVLALLMAYCAHQICREHERMAWRMFGFCGGADAPDTVLGYDLNLDFPLSVALSERHMIGLKQLAGPRLSRPYAIEYVELGAEKRGALSLKLEVNAAANAFVVTEMQIVNVLMTGAQPFARGERRHVYVDDVRPSGSVKRPRV